MFPALPMTLTNKRYVKYVVTSLLWQQFHAKRAEHPARSPTTVKAGRKLTSRSGSGVITSSHRPLTPWLNRNRRLNNLKQQINRNQSSVRPIFLLFSKLTRVFRNRRPFLNAIEHMVRVHRFRLKYLSVSMGK